MGGRYIKIVVVIIFVFGSFYTKASENDLHLPEMVSEIAVFSGNPRLSIDSIKKLPEGSFKEITKSTVFDNENFWLRVSINNKLAQSSDYFIHFNNSVYNVRLFQNGVCGENTLRQGGIKIPEKKRSVGLIIRDKVPFHIDSSDSTVLYIQIKNPSFSIFNIDNINIVPFENYLRYSFRVYVIQSFFVGLVFILCFFNLILYFLNRNKLHLYYFFYALVTSLYFLFFFGVLETLVFPNSPEINYYFFFSVIVSQPLYVWFLFQALKNEKITIWRQIIKIYAIVSSIITFLILVISLFYFPLGVYISDICSIVNSVFFISLIFFLYRKVSKTVRIIFLGSFFLVLGGSSALITNFRETEDLHIYFYQLGFVIELLFFTLAINYMHHSERMEKIKARLLNSNLEAEKLKKEKEALKLREEVDLKNRDLASKVVIISEKEELLKRIIAQLSEVTGSAVNNLVLNKIIATLKSSLHGNNWNEFEAHFNNVHPRFYKVLISKYPHLTPNERKLCAFLKLNLSTKEISVITGKSQNTIDVARSRLRKKMRLTTDVNLASVIANIS